MISGITKPTSGELLIDRHHWSREDLRNIGALIEMPPLYENLTAFKNLKVRTIMLGLPDSRIREVLEIVNLTETGKKRAGQFLLGMKQRLGIALALLSSPKLLILDEPTNGLDPIGTLELRELIIRPIVDCPIIFLTAKTMENDITAGLSIGGDDYLTKPFRISELRARINAHLRRERRDKHISLHLDRIKIKQG